MPSVSISSLVLDPVNARKHSTKNLDAIKGSLARFGQQKPIVVTKSNVVIAGNGTLEAAKALGWDTIDVKVTELEGTEAVAYALADNRSGELAEWDMDVLGSTLQSLKDLDFDLGSIGFDDADLAKMIATPVQEGLTDPDDVPENVETRCKPGDLWVLGKHRLLCGDSTNVQHVERLMGGEKADMVYTDPPYGIGYSGKGITAGVKGNDFGAIKGDDDVTTAVDAYRLCKALEVPVMVFWGANFYCSALDDRCSWIVWDKQVVGEFYSACELAWTNQTGRIKQFIHKWHGMVKGSEHGQARVHPTQKPIALAEWCMSEYDGAQTVLDLFLGSGSTLIACEKTGRRCFGMELDPKYCDVILARWEAFTGLTASLITAGETAP